MAGKSLGEAEQKRDNRNGDKQPCCREAGVIGFEGWFAFLCAAGAVCQKLENSEDRQGRYDCCDGFGGKKQDESG
ncbi:MAG: hypothetical protein IKV48_04830 [Eggerthellaceae bacterium]|nr:hypothetical protein [Eggerthellaceae bacterium]